MEDEVVRVYSSRSPLAPTLSLPVELVPSEEIITTGKLFLGQQHIRDGALPQDLHDGCLVAHVLLVHEVVGFGKESERLIGWRDVHEAGANVVSVLLSDYAIVGEPLQIGKGVLQKNHVGIDIEERESQLQHLEDKGNLPPHFLSEYG